MGSKVTSQVRTNFGMVQQEYVIIIIISSSGNIMSKWSKMQEVIMRVISNLHLSAQREADLKKRAQLPLNCMTGSPISINYVNSTMPENLELNILYN